jgi:hypothetical protein
MWSRTRTRRRTTTTTDDKKDENKEETSVTATISENILDILE